ncbi:class I SAM-dependent methyltransferase [Actinophytocola sp. NPDC049390]|uniref:class I SAM-dependent methyltransferase n=1 Tax=Actinophytocola sp. NPDC049390 TaxID=3363894 RepID=UPI0037B2D826
MTTTIETLPAAPPRSPFRAWAAERVFRYAVRDLPVTVSFPDGSRLGRGGPELRIVRPSAFFHRLGAQANIGFGEAYMAGDWTADDPAAALTPFAARMATLVPAPLQVLRRWVDARRPAAERNTPDGARANIHRHYDLSNELFEAFLDESMTYSSAWFEPGDDLHAAQLRKIDGILDYAGVRAGSRVLEIGTGWGALAIRAAQRGATVTSLTISVEQRRLAEERAAAAGVADRVTVSLTDYRDAGGTYDAVVSVEMIEAVGEEFWPAYFATLARVLAPGGRVGLQAITMPHDRLMVTRRSHNWIQKYIFPGGVLLSVPVIEEQAARVGLRVVRRRSLGPHYARTLAQWRARFEAAREQVAALGFDEVFGRLWEFYLAYSEAGFRSRYLDVWQFGLRAAG